MVWLILLWHVFRSIALALEWKNTGMLDGIPRKILKIKELGCTLPPHGDTKSEVLPGLVKPSQIFGPSFCEGAGTLYRSTEFLGGKPGSTVLIGMLPSVFGAIYCFRSGGNDYRQQPIHSLRETQQLTDPTTIPVAASRAQISALHSRPFQSASMLLGRREGWPEGHLQTMQKRDIRGKDVMGYVCICIIIYIYIIYIVDSIYLAIWIVTSSNVNLRREAQSHFETLRHRCWFCLISGDLATQLQFDTGKWWFIMEFGGTPLSLLSFQPCWEIPAYSSLSVHFLPKCLCVVYLFGVYAACLRLMPVNAGLLGGLLGGMIIYSYPIGSMYGIYANIGGILMVNVTIYGIHGSYGYGSFPHSLRETHQ